MSATALATQPFASSSRRGISMELRGIRKSFGETKALQGIDLAIRSGEILGIAGPNGAGKSTLVRILAGEETRDAGDILVDERPWSTGDPRDRVAVVHQEPQLWPNLTVAQNMAVGREGSALTFPRDASDDLPILRQLAIERYVDRPLAECPLTVRQRVEIARALAIDARFFLFDEPNSALTEDESDQLFAAMHDLAERGRVVMLVSHRLGEMEAHCDRVAIIRDGIVAAELSGANLTEAGIARELVKGYQAVDTDASEARSAGSGEAAPASPAADGSDLVLSTSGWSSVRGGFRDVALRIGRGEVLACVGVEGSGAREIVASTAGYGAAVGEIQVASVSGSAALASRTVYLPADRRGMLFHNLSVGQNLVMRLGTREIGLPGGFLSPRRLRRVADELVERFRVRTRSSGAPLPSLSGGNQQKVAIAAAIARRPALLALEEPTRGVDVGSKAEIYRILRDYAAEGHGVLVYCTEVPEVYELADRVIVVDVGRASEPMTVSDFADLTALADAIATFEHTSVGPEDLVKSHAHARADDAAS
ncbi:sugar ABC transporter ATP-binding protein [soil metagenome]